MNKWYFVDMGSSTQHPHVSGPFDSKADILLHYDWSHTRKSGSLYETPDGRGVIGRKKDLIKNGFDLAFE